MMMRQVDDCELGPSAAPTACYAAWAEPGTSRPMRVTPTCLNSQGRLGLAWLGYRYRRPAAASFAAVLASQQVRLPAAFSMAVFFTITRFLRLPKSLLFLVTPAGGFRKTLFYKPSTHMRAQKKRYFQGAKTQGNGKKKRNPAIEKNS